MRRRKDVIAAAAHPYTKHLSDDRGGTVAAIALGRLRLGDQLSRGSEDEAANPVQRFEEPFRQRIFKTMT